MRSGMASASMELMRFEQRRFRSASGGDGTWPDLTFSTKQKRIRRDARAAKSKTRITRQLVMGQHVPIELDTGTLERGLFEQGGSGHFQKITADAVSEGVAGGSHPRFKGTVGALAAIQHYGAGHVPARPLMAQPDGAAMTMIGAKITQGVQATVAAVISQYGGAAPAAGFGTP